MNFRMSLTLVALAALGLMTGCRAATVLSYETCIYDSDCRTGTDTCIALQHNGATTHICSSRCTSGGPACPTDAYGGIGSCVSFDSGASFHCYQTCTPGSSLCEFGSSCVTETGGGFTTNICLPGGGSSTVPAYAGCAAGMTCQAGTQCIGVKDGRTLDLCTVTHCGSDADCPRDSRGGNGACVSLDGDSFGTCVERCNTTSDCTYGSMGAERCTTHTAMGVTLPPPGVCLPT
jgi:hypothetical protein